MTNTAIERAPRRRPEASKPVDVSIMQDKLAGAAHAEVFA
jgi:hypothetical protein